MRVPQVSERIKEAPAQALRGVFAGIGQLLLYTDKLRNKAPYAHVPAAPPSPAAAPRTEPTAPVPDRPASAASAPADQEVVAEPAVVQTPKTPKTPKTARAPKTPAAPRHPETPAAAPEIRDFDKTGNVRLITADEARPDDEPTAAAPVTPAVSEPEPPVAAAPGAAEAVPEPSSAPADAEPPLPNYGQLSIASLRARLRNLDVTQVRGLVEYEKGHAGRTDVLTMLERRIAKLEAGD
ncbi:MAG TPA: hypothetical protein VIX15_13010 [Streptosporangiaceae bacterium]